MSAVRVAVVGSGWWATAFHIPAVLADPRAQLRALVDPHAERLAAARAAAGGPPGYFRLEDLLSDGDVDAVVIATPHSTHVPLAQACVERGLAVLVEKPVGTAAADAAALVAAATARGVPLVTGYTWSWVPYVQRAQELAPRVGPLRLVTGIYCSMVERLYAGDPRAYDGVMPYSVLAPQSETYSDRRLSGGGQLRTQVCHLLGMLLQITGDHVLTVAARTRGEPEADATLLLELAGGAVAIVGSTGALAPGQLPPQELRLVGEQGVLRVDLQAGVVELQLPRESSQRWDDGPSYPTDAPVRTLIDLVLDPQAANPAPGGRAVQVAQILDAAYVSTAAGGPPVRVSES